MQESEIWTARAYAKINIGLYVNERLPNGYHDISTGFCFIDWSDQLRVRFSNRHQLRMTNPDIPADETNLINKAVRMLDEAVGLKHQYLIDVNKRIPAGAGLGGGSSDAALILRMLNHIEEAGLSDGELAKLGSLIGSDVPLFIYNKTALGTGTGTRLKPLSIQPDAWIVTVYPNFECPTADIYRYCEPNPYHEFDLETLLLEQNHEEWRYTLDNDLEPSAIMQYPMIGNIRDQFYEFGASYASMSGSGSSVFGIFEQDFVAQSCFEDFRNLGMTANLTKPRFSPDTGIYILT